MDGEIPINVYVHQKRNMAYTFGWFHVFQQELSTLKECAQGSLSLMVLGGQQPWNNVLQIKQVRDLNNDTENTNHRVVEVVTIRTQTQDTMCK